MHFQVFSKTWNSCPKVINYFLCWFHLNFFTILFCLNDANYLRSRSRQLNFDCLFCSKYLLYLTESFPKLLIFIFRCFSHSIEARTADFEYHRDSKYQCWFLAFDDHFLIDQFQVWSLLFTFQWIVESSDYIISF
jgi:hypothetical protein